MREFAHQREVKLLWISVSLAKVHNRANFNGSIFGVGTPGCITKSFVQVGRLNQVIAAQMFFGFGERPIGV